MTIDLTVRYSIMKTIKAYSLFNNLLSLAYSIKIVGKQLKPSHN